LLRVHLAEPLVALHVDRRLAVAVPEARRDGVALVLVVGVILFLALATRKRGGCAM